MKRQNQKDISYIIVDDDYLTIGYLKDLMKLHKGFKCIGEYQDVIEAIDGINNLNADFIFLDIEMPEMTGFEMLKFINRNNTKVIIITSHREFAHEGFDNHVFDYLCKPIKQNRLYECLNLLKKEICKENQEDNVQQKLIDNNKLFPYLLVRPYKERKNIQILKSEIYYIQKWQNSLKVVDIHENVYNYEDSLKAIMKILPEKDFSYANQSYIFNIHKAICYDGKNIIMDQNDVGSHIFISKNHRKNFKVS